MLASAAVETRDLAIGVFDSGVGGLTVLRALQERLPLESTVYLGDTARVPYGTRSSAVVTRYALGNAHFLMSQNIKMLVVACNTVSAESLPALASQVSIPVIGVVEPGAASACAVSQGRRVGVIGTQGTIHSRAYQKAIARLDSKLEVSSQACPLFVPLAEEGWIQGEVPRLAAERYLADFKREGVGTLVLGCTHYPILQEVIAQVMGPEVTLVDSAKATAEAVEQKLRQLDLLSSQKTPEHRVYVTDIPGSFPSVAQRFLGKELTHLEQVDVKV